MTATAPLLCGCNLSHWIENDFKVGPEYSKPETSISEDWIDSDSPAILDQPPRFPRWWSVFDDPVLDALIETARRENLTLREAGFRVLRARAERAIAVGNLLPQTQQAFGEFERIWESRNVAAAAPLRSFGQWTAGLDVSWELDVWGRFRRAVEAADAALDASVYDYDAVAVSLIAEVVTAYVDIRVFQQRLEYARGNVETQRASLALTLAQAEAGKTDEVGVHLSRSNLATTEASIPPLETGLRQAGNRLCVLLGKPPTDLGEILGSGEGKGVPVAPEQVAVGIPADLLRRRPDVRAAERRVAEQSANIGVAASDLYPSIFVAGEIAVESEHFGKLFNSASLNSAAGPSFRWNILNYGRLVNNVRAQEAGIKEIVAANQNAVLKANREVEDELIAFFKSKQQTRLLAESVEQTRRALELLLIQYTEGEINFSPIFILQTTLTQLQDQLATAAGDSVTSLVGVYKALGGGWESRAVDPVMPADVDASDSSQPLRPPAQVSSRPARPGSADLRP